MKGGDRFGRSPDTHREVAIATRQAYRELVEKIERGASLSENDRRTLAAIVRAAAGEISTVSPKSKGEQPRYSHASAALRWAWLRHHDEMSSTAAAEQVAEEYEVTLTAIRKVIKVHGEWAMRQFSGVPKRPRRNLMRD